MPLEVILIYQIHYHLHHHILFLGTTLGNHQRKCHQSIVGNTLPPFSPYKIPFSPLTCKKIHIIRLLNLCNFCTCDISVKLSFLETVIDMTCYFNSVSTKEFHHLACTQPKPFHFPFSLEVWYFHPLAYKHTYQLK